MSRSDSSTGETLPAGRARPGRTMSRCRDRRPTAPPSRPTSPWGLLHRGRRRPRPRPSERGPGLGGPGRRGARRHATRASATPTSRSAAASSARCSTSRSSRRSRWARTWSASTPAATTSCGRRSTSTLSSRVRRGAAAGCAPPARTWCVFTGYDLGRARCSVGCAAGWRRYNELVREVADDLEATVVDFWRMREYRDPRMWASTGSTCRPLGHRHMATAVLDALGVRTPWRSTRCPRWSR